MDGETDINSDELDRMLRAKFFSEQSKLLKIKYGGDLPEEQVWGVEQKAYMEIPGSLEAHLKWSRAYDHEMSGESTKNIQ